MLFSLAVVAGLWHWKPFHWALAGGLVVAYGLYVRRHFRGPVERDVRYGGPEVSPAGAAPGGPAAGCVQS